ncbi:MAG: response regulator [Chloroflexota bacterium]
MSASPPNPLALIIEDDPQLSEIFSLALQSDFEVQAITDGSVAQAVLAEAVPALVVLDLHLPGVKGQEILEQIRSDPRLSATRVLLATADERRAETLRDQADIVLLKPVSPSQLRGLARRFRPGGSA